MRSRRSQRPLSLAHGLQEPWPDAVAGPSTRGRPRPVGDADVAALKAKVLESGLTTAQLVGTTWASAASSRSTGKRGNAHGARIRFEPQRG